MNERVRMGYEIILVKYLRGHGLVKPWNILEQMDSNSPQDAAKDFAWLLLPKVPEGTYTSPLSTVVYLALFTDEFCFVMTVNLKFISV